MAEDPDPKHNPSSTMPMRSVDSGTLMASSCSWPPMPADPDAHRHHHDATYLTSMPMTASQALPPASTPIECPRPPSSFQIQQLVDTSDLHKLYSMQPSLSHPAPTSPPLPSSSQSAPGSPPLAAAKITGSKTHTIEPTLSIATPSSAPNGMVTKLKLHAADFAHRMDDATVLRSRRDWSYVRDGWPSKSPGAGTPTPPPKPLRRGAAAPTGPGSPIDANHAVASFLCVTCLPPGLVDLDPVARAQVPDTDAPAAKPRRDTAARANSSSPIAASPASKSRVPDPARKRPTAAPAADPVLRTPASVRPQSADPTAALARRGPTPARIVTLEPSETPAPTGPRPSSAGGAGFPARPRSAGLRGMLPLKRHASGETARRSASPVLHATLYSPSRHIATTSGGPPPGVQRLPGLRKLSSMFPGSTSSPSSVVNAPAPARVSTGITLDLAADLQSLGLAGVRCVGGTGSPAPATTGSPSRAGFAASAGASSPKATGGKQRLARARQRGAAATLTPSDVAVAAAAAAAIVQVATADVMQAAGVVQGMGGAGGMVGAGGAAGLGGPPVGVSSKYNRLSALPRLEFARVKYAA